MDINVQAFRLVRQATTISALPENVKRASSRKGGLKGGLARAMSISAERRSEIAKKASAARWNK